MSALEYAPAVHDALLKWAEDQRALARALDLSLEAWISALEEAGTRATGLTAAVVGAAVARGSGLGVLEGLDGPAVAERARRVLAPDRFDEAPPEEGGGDDEGERPRASHPVIDAVLRRGGELAAGQGARRL